jgi:hypothetical protein
LERLCTYALVGALSPTLSRAPYACSDATSTGLCSSGNEKQFSEKCASPFRNSDAEIVRMRGERAYACRCVLGCVRGRGACAFSVCVCVRVRECVRVRIPYATPEGVPDTLIARAGEDRKDQNLLTATGSWFRSVGETPSVRFRSIAITLDQVCSLFIAPVRIACPHFRVGARIFLFAEPGHKTTRARACVLGHRSTQWRARVLALRELTRPRSHRGALAHRGNVTMGALAAGQYGADDGARGLRKKSEPGPVRHHCRAGPAAKAWTHRRRQRSGCSARNLTGKAGLPHFHARAHLPILAMPASPPGPP